MTETVVFVHGTGVRGEVFGRYFGLIREHLQGRGGRPTHGCFWGEAEGAEFRAGGASVPDYDRTGGDEPTEEEEGLALWSILYADPWYELRLLADWPSRAGQLAPGQVTAEARLIDQVQRFQASPELEALLARHRLVGPWTQALDDLRAAPEFRRAARAAEDPMVNVHRKALARALVARTLVAAEGTGSIAGQARDELVAAVTLDLHGAGMGVAGWLTRPFKGVAATLATRYVARRRGAITDASYPMVGDIVRYQSRGRQVRDHIRRFVVDTVANDPDPSVTLIGHSLGGIACVETLIEEPLPEVRRLITVGSQAPFFYEIDALDTLVYGHALPDHFPSEWLNIYDRRDLLAYVGEGLFAGRVTDVEVDNGQPFPEAHSAYWSNEAVWDAIDGFLA